jgi:hypothetical protein
VSLTDLSTLIQAILFLLFADLTSLIAAVIGPTYDNLLVPELSPGALYPPLAAASAGPSDFLAPASRFSGFLIGNVVDPAIALVALGVAVLYLARAVVPRWNATFTGLLPRLVLAVVGANFAGLIAGGILDVAGSLYPVVAGWDGGAWQNWVRLAGFGELSFSWDNGAVAFVLSLAEFALVIALVLAIGVRDALLAVLVVLLPLLTLLWPFRPVSSIPRRAWFLFAELAFLPTVLVVPLELAVGSPTPVILVGYLGVALASPFLLSVASTHLVAVGFPGAAGVVQGGTSRGLSAAPGAATAAAAPAANALRAGGAASRTVASGVRAAGSATTPLAAPLAVRDLLGQGALHLARHVGRPGARDAPPKVPPLRPGGAG